jgi:hypothetical protein
VIKAALTRYAIGLRARRASQLLRDVVECLELAVRQPPERIQQRAEPPLLDALRSPPDREFESLDDVAVELART